MRLTMKERKRVTAIIALLASPIFLFVSSERGFLFILARAFFNASRCFLVLLYTPTGIVYLNLFVLINDYTNLVYHRKFVHIYLQEYTTTINLICSVWTTGRKFSGLLLPEIASES
jgi:hypothetical protein